MQNKEQKSKMREEELKAQKRKITTCLNEMVDWTVNFLNFEALSAHGDKSMQLDLNLPDKKNKLEAACNSLRD